MDGQRCIPGSLADTRRIANVQPIANVEPANLPAIPSERPPQPTADEPTISGEQDRAAGR